MRITKKQDEEAIKVLAAVKANDGFCPCALTKSDDTRCMCKAFIERQSTGECSCGLYIKMEV